MSLCGSARNRVWPLEDALLRDIAEHKKLAPSPATIDMCGSFVLTSWTESELRSWPWCRGSPLSVASRAHRDPSA